MASYFPLILDTQLTQIGMLPQGDDLDLTGSNIINLPSVSFSNTGNIIGNVSFSNGNVSLGNVGNLQILGGLPGQILRTDGAGNLSFAAFTPNIVLNGASNIFIPNANSNINFSVNAIANVATLSSNTFTVNGAIIANSLQGSYANGNSNIAIQANGDVGISVAGQSNVLLVTSTGSRASSTFSDDVTVTGNLVVLGNTTTVTTASLAVQSPIIEEGGGANGTVLTSQDSQDRGILMHTYGDGTARVTSANALIGSNTISMANTTGLLAGMLVTYANNATYIPDGTVITQVNASNIVISANLVGPIPGNSTLAIGTDLDRFMGWDHANAEFSFGSNVTISNNVIGYNELGNVRGNWFIGVGGLASQGNLTVTNNATIGGNVTATTFTGILANGTSSVRINTNANVWISANGNVVANIVSSGNGNLQTTGANIFGYITATGNITAPTLVGTLANGNSSIAISANASIVMTANSNAIFTLASSGNGNLQTTGATLNGYASISGNVSTPANFVGTWANGNTNMRIATANGNVTLSVSGNSNVVVWSANATAAQMVVTANANVNGNLHVLNNNSILLNSGTRFAGFRANTTTSANYTLTLPANAGANNHWLMVDGGGNLRFSNTFVRYAETVVNGGNVSGAVTPDLNAGTIFKYRLIGNTTISTMGNVSSGSSFVIILQQDGTGGRTLTWGSSWLFSSNSRILSIGANVNDVVAAFYDGTNYYATLTRGFE